MENFNSHYTHKAHGLSTVHFRSPYTKTSTDSLRTQPVAQRDEISFSEEAKSLSEVNVSASSSTAVPRFDLINRVRAEIAAGTYDTPEKMDVALERMLSSF